MRLINHKIFIPFLNIRNLDVKRLIIFMGAASIFLPFFFPQLVCSKIRTCPPIYLKTEKGEVINPVTGENSEKPYSTRQTCGACHDYEKITQGYHFQQGWDRISDNYNKKMPWVLSDGMMGKQ